MKLHYEKQLIRLVDVMTDNRGLIQHSKGSEPDLNFGYSIDDVSRGLVVLARTFPRFEDAKAHKVYLDYIKRAQRTDGFFHNFYEAYNGQWNWRAEDSSILQDCFGRVIWALAEFTGSKYPRDERKEAEKIFLEHLDLSQKLRFNASKSFALSGLSDYFFRTQDKNAERIARELAENLAENFKNHSDKDWRWFADEMTYCNPRLPHSMIKAGYVLGDKELINVGKSSLDFLIENSFDESGIFHAIGNKGWFEKGKIPAKYDQQTVEAGDMVEVCVDACKISASEKYKKYAKKAFQWFSGKNIFRKSMMDSSGGVYDAITENGINKNQGAESLLSYLLAATKLE